MEPIWEPNGHLPPHPVKYENDAVGYAYCGENGLNFSATNAAYSEDDAECLHGRRIKPSRQDPLSHRIIEKRRRDRMNSCLADLSRLIPPQFQRKGRGRIEKTEIIEMSIRYMKQLQKQECIDKEYIYKAGFEDCLHHAASFLYSRNENMCFKMVDYVRSHIDTHKKRDFCSMKPAPDSISASSGSPPANGYHHTVPSSNHVNDLLLHDDMDHSNSNDGHNDIKDLSFGCQPQQAPVITSTAPLVHLDSSSHDFDSSRASSVHADNGHPVESDSFKSVRVRKLSESPPHLHHHDPEHPNNYKFKNYIQQRFSQDNGASLLDAQHHDDANTANMLDERAQRNSSKSPGSDVTSCPTKKSKLCSDFAAECSSCDETIPISNGHSDTKNRSIPIANSLFIKPSNPISIFAQHSRGNYYVPLKVEYDALVPYLNGFDLFDRNYGVRSFHSVNINVNFFPSV